jgi:UDP-N-acetylglucosamine transferase subunit ALG13
LIFVTVGDQMPFDRLVREVDEWARAQGRHDVRAQIGRTDYRPHTLEVLPHLSAADYKATLEAADVVIGHAGMGTILSALVAGKPLLVMPRRGALRETRNDHQVATAERMHAMGFVRVALDEGALRRELEHIDGLCPTRRIGPHASPELLETVRSFIAGPTIIAGSPPPAVDAPRDVQPGRRAP